MINYGQILEEKAVKSKSTGLDFVLRTQTNSPTSKANFYFAVNECEERTDLCENGRCIDTTWWFRCECNHGYRYAVESEPMCRGI